MINKKKRSNKLDSSPSLVVKEKKKGQRYRLPQSGITHRERVFDVGRPFSVCTDCTSPGEKELLARFCCSVRPPSFWQFFCHQRLFVPTLHFANMHLHWHSKKKKKKPSSKAHTQKKKIVRSIQIKYKMLPYERICPLRGSGVSLLSLSYHKEPKQNIFWLLKKKKERKDDNMWRKEGNWNNIVKCDLLLLSLWEHQLVLHYFSEIQAKKSRLYSWCIAEKK